MKKFFRPNIGNKIKEPGMALTKMEIQKLLNGRKEPITSGFGTADLFNNPLLRRIQKKLTSKEIFTKIFEKRRRIGMQINNSGIKISTFNPPTKFTFRHKDSLTDIVNI